MLTKKKVYQIAMAKTAEERQALIDALSDREKAALKKLEANAAKMHKEGAKILSKYEK